MSANDPRTPASAGALHLGPKLRDRFARPVVFVYWMTLALGLLVYALEVGNSLPLWIGAIAGTALGHCLALRDLRLWFVTAVCGGTVYLGVMLAPSELGGTQLWLAFVPAVFCAYASLSDRFSLAALWFPAVIWMLTILDRTSGTTSVDGFGAVLLGAVAIAYIIFLRVRESRRVEMWTRVAAQPLAATKPAEILRDSPSLGFMRTGWTVGVTAITFAATAWLAPKLWKLETFRHREQQVAHHTTASYGGTGRPCPTYEEVQASRTRVREYLDLGRGRDDQQRELEREYTECVEARGTGYGYGAWGRGMPVELPTLTYQAPPDLPPSLPSGYEPSGTTYAAPLPAPTYTPPAPVAYVPPAPTAPPAPYVAPRQHPVAPVAPPVQAPVPPLSYPPPPPALVASHAPRPPAPPPVAAPLTTPPIATPATIAPRTDGPRDTSILRWLAALIAGVLIFQVVSVALRPLRRALTLRHLRSPLWQETVDQRVSNSWQLALVGLRDGGWRPTAGETPLAFAKRVKLSDLERCATILERTRYGIQIDADDLTSMSEAADAAYHAARAQVSPVSRAMSALRWPLV